MLVDFDDVGLHGTDRCSIYLHPHTVGMLNVKGMQIMDRSHDLENLNRLMERLSGVELSF